MSTNTELIARLREGQTYDFNTGLPDDMSCPMDDAADAIEALEIKAAACVNEYRELEIANEQLKAQLAAAQGQITLTETEIDLGAHIEDCGDWNDLKFRDFWHEGFSSGAKFALEEIRDKSRKGAVKRFVGLDAEEIARIPLNEHTVQTVESLLRKKNAAPIPQQPAEPAHVWVAMNKVNFMLFANEADARQLQPTATSDYEVFKSPVFGQAAPIPQQPSQQAQPEPVAYRFTHNEGNGKTRFTYHDETPENHHRTAYKDTCLKIEPLQLVQQAQPERAPKIDYFVIQKYASAYRLDYNRLSEMVREAIKQGGQHE